jgi:Protein of unknown function (DUF3606)
MADGKKKTGLIDRSKVAATEGYELAYFAKEHGISKDLARAMIRKIGNNREKLNKAAQKIKNSPSF